MFSFVRSLTLILLSTTLLFAIERVPKQYTLESGWIYTHKNQISGTATNGFTVMFDFAWQLTGLDSTRAASYISVPIGYTYFPQDPSISIISYGWTVRHNLLKNRAVIPFLGYGLLLNQLSYKLDKGKRFGHQTRLDVGVDWVLKKPIQLFTKAEWSMSRFPDHIVGGSDWFYTIALKIGVRFNRPARSSKSKPIDEKEGSSSE